MTKLTSDPLLALGKIVVILAQALMGLAAAAVAIGTPIVLLMKDKAQADLRAELGNPDFIFPAFSIAGLLILALAILLMAFFFFDRLRRIIDSVGAGDPFEPANATRLTAMAWLMLGIQLLAIPAAGLGLYLVKIMEETEATVDASLDLSGIVMVVTLFILARVFRHGSAMRADLEGTV
ncbi:DUF2975 domain-containing protein [Qipengyuania aurantiaca]|uniref:DUF2975 domain-containing protein n=1 Tax=Qipengyuania aurantiaca TaxID=2867233 RepID=A0ABX8ZPB6_9SPHN|nr:DUF2975 domain-containing protein [Qipengyuania aurantiaca]QZD90571.1 DUF2975 domain-containing protein [Qipengyuania aurantiaca]